MPAMTLTSASWHSLNSRTLKRSWLASGTGLEMFKRSNQRPFPLRDRLVLLVFLVLVAWLIYESYDHSKRWKLFWEFPDGNMYYSPMIICEGNEDVFTVLMKYSPVKGSANYLNAVSYLQKNGMPEDYDHTFFAFTISCLQP